VPESQVNPGTAVNALGACLQHLDGASVKRGKSWL